MRTRRTLLNLAYALLSSVVVLVLGLVTRKLLVVNFGPTVSGAASVVEKLFTFFPSRSSALARSSATACMSR